MGSIAKTAKLPKLPDTTRPPADLPVPSQKFQHINIDLVGLLTPSHGYTYLFTVADRFSRWAEAFPSVESSARACGKALSMVGYPGLDTSRHLFR